VALLAAAAVIEGGRQAALMAPTELLARQHFKTIAPLAAAAGINVAVLTGRERGASARISSKSSPRRHPCLIGTHALFQEEVEFRDLALAVVDEQHRFGVHQRLALAKKGEAVDVLVMTATPIPRTLVLTYFGDMDMSELREKPAGRKPIDTRRSRSPARGGGRRGRPRARRGPPRLLGLSAGRGTENTDLAAAEERFAALKERFGAMVDLVHGRMKGATKTAPWSASLPGKRASLWPPPSSKWASTCPRRRSW
jgi:ATP-dependent DNA helicase RecG